ncbi:hypothetical protein [Cytophaga sp. FL35]|uniref:hypothetical protein n=1 Tax=Cytophaga sp. FL35 TaxID=1904456 RepID=UPI001653A013|nr:hypothetical protein [Cytophaga sp. FL35]MBC6997106.1 hypothetical protein [Cytophaga sp. FL35]
MATTISNYGKQTNLLNTQADVLKTKASKLYKLKTKFEKKYFKLSGCRKYEKARDFNINLNSALYQVNQMLHVSSNKTNTNNYQKIDFQISQLEQQLASLIA